MYLKNLFIFPGLETTIYFTMTEKLIFFFSGTKDETIFFSAYYSKSIGHSANITRVIQSVESLVM